MSENQNINVEPKIGEEVTNDGKAEEKSFIEKAKESFFANGGTVTKANSGSSGRKRNRTNRPGSNKKKAGKGNSASSGGRKPVLSMWKMLNIKVGQKLLWIDGKGTCDKTSAVVLDDFSMKLEVTYRNKKKVVDGLMRGEIFARNMKKLPCPKKPQGWDKWGIERKGKVVSIHSIYDSLTAEQLIQRRGF